jgi:hypothetical protein
MVVSRSLMDGGNATRTAVGEQLSASIENGTARTTAIQEAYTGRWASMNNK